MAMSLRTYLNNQIKAKGSSLTKEKANAGKYKSIAAAKKAGSLYYTNKDGKIMAAVYAEDLKKSSPKPKLGAGNRPKVTTKTLVPGTGKTLDEILAQPKKSSKVKPNPRPTIAQLKAEQRKLRTKIANARQKGKDDKAAAARIKQLTTMINRLK